MARTRYRCGSGRKGGGSLPRQESATGERPAQRSALSCRPLIRRLAVSILGRVAAAQPPHSRGSGIC